MKELELIFHASLSFKYVEGKKAHRGAKRRLEHCINCGCREQVWDQAASLFT